jgi:hypothetical protein
MKKLIRLIFCSFLASSCIIHNPKPEKCFAQTETIINIRERSTNDILFSDTHGDNYYINGGLELVLNLDSLNAKVLNKTVTLHLPKLMGDL